MSFVPFDEFDQDCKFPHKSSRTILDDLVSEFDGVQSIQAGIGIVVDDTDPANPFVSAIPDVLPQATNVVLGGIRLGENLIYDSESGLVNVTIPPVPVQSVNGKTGGVVLDSADVGADPVGSATTAIGTHLADADPHPQYTTVAEAAAAAPVQSVNGMTGAVTLEEEVLQYANLAAFPVSGADATLYIAADTGIVYRWDGSNYVAVGGGSGADVVMVADEAALPATGDADVLYLAVQEGSFWRWSTITADWRRATPTVAIVSALPATGVSGVLYVRDSAGVPPSLWHAGEWVTLGITNAASLVASTSIAAGDPYTLYVNDPSQRFYQLGLLGGKDTLTLDIAGIMDDASAEGQFYFVSAGGILNLNVVAAGFSVENASFGPVSPGQVTTISVITAAGGVRYAYVATGLPPMLHGYSPLSDVVVLQAKATGANCALVLAPKGNGPVQSQVATGSTAGGNVRGAYATDWQRTRSSGAHRVASGSYATISGGRDNQASGEDSSVLGGSGNVAQGNGSTVGGLSNQTHGSGINSVVCGGSFNAVSASTSVIGGGSVNTVSGSGFAFIGSGYGNVVSGQYSAVLCGYGCTADAYASYAYGDRAHTGGLNGCVAFASARITSAGDAQNRVCQLIGYSTSASAINLTVNRAAIGGSTTFCPQNDSLVRIKGRATAKQRGVMANFAVWEFSATMTRGATASTVALVSAVAPTLIESGGTGNTWSLTVAANTTVGGIQVQGTGEASMNINWICEIDALEIVG